ncbi:MAG TPA: hypothetical protein EYN67_20340 [Flavobacteriales bacterium]|nr:hypothetical protein [Methylococcaceae bacterium]HHZ97833.1 hypothetical protein [Flavobacteriales bacterium]
MKAKYLSDGRKVVVIGQLNNVESIVQEVFVSEGGDQIPSGEKFTTKNLHDEPVKSWKEKKTEEYDAQYAKSESRVHSINKEIREMENKRRSHAKIIASNLRQINELEDVDVNHLSDVMARNIKWVCATNWNWQKVMSFNEFIEIRSSYDEGVKLISVHIKNDKTLMYKVGSYSDGSGSSSEYKFFNCKEKLKDFLLESYKRDTEKGYMNVSTFDSLKDTLDLPESDREELLQIEVSKAEDLYQKEMKRITEQRAKTLALKVSVK